MRGLAFFICGVQFLASHDDNDSAPVYDDPPQNTAATIKRDDSLSISCKARTELTYCYEFFTIFMISHFGVGLGKI